MDETIIEFNNVSFTYEAEENNPEKPAVKNVNLKINRGEFIAVLGHNGSGKSTLAKLTNAILVPDEGKVTVAGMDTSDESKVYDIRRKVGMVFQNPDNQIVSTIVEDDVAFGPENLGIPPEEIRRRVDEALKCVEMYDFRLYEPHRLSGGQKQRVAIAGILAMRTDCIVLDESTAMLDPRGRKEVMDTIRRLNREHGITVVFITHFMDEAVEADRVVVMNDSRIFMDGTPYEVFADIKKIKKIGLDVPQAAELANELRESGISIPENILTSEECVQAVLEVVNADNRG